MSERIAIACDHAGVELKQKLTSVLTELGNEVINLGTDNNESVDYPDYAEKVCDAIISKRASKGVLICGSGIGMSMVANRFPQIRAALCHNIETAKLSRQHNNANVLVVGQRTTDPNIVLEMVRAFFTTPFEGGRHQRRIDKFSNDSESNTA